MALRRLFNRIDFVGGWKRWFSISGVLLLLGFGAVLLGNLNFGIDFQGGAKFTVADPESLPGERAVRDAMPDFVQDEAVVLRAGDGYEVRTPPISENQRGQVRDALQEELGAEVSETSVSPTFGTQIRNQALQAVAAALLVIVVFISIRFEFAFALAAMVAVVHDVLMTIGFYAIVGREVNLVTVVAVLTVLGYSLYDTIIIFDRIRENAPAMGYNRRRFDEMVNNSIRQVIMRSIYTSVSTIVPVTALLIFGESTLSDFAFALLVGIIAGTYSSLFIASPVLSLYKAWQASRPRPAESSA